MSRPAFDPTVPTLTNPRADRVRTVHGLAQRSGRRRTGQYLVEGPQAVREVVRWTPDRVRDVYLTPESAARYPEIVEESAGMFRHLGTAEVLAAMSPDAQGVLAVVTAPTEQIPDTPADRTTSGPWGAASLPAVLATRPRLIALLAQVRDPGNLGTVIRVADAAGADAVIVAGDAVEVTNPKVVRSTAGSLFHLPVVHGLSVPEAVSALQEAGVQILAADGAGTLDLDDLQDEAVRGESGPADLTRPTAWLFGNEAWGLPEDDRAAADAVVKVPLRGHAESLNLATAAAVCLYASSRAHR